MTVASIAAGIAVGYAAFVILTVLRGIRRQRALEVERFQQEIDDYRGDSA